MFDWLRDEEQSKSRHDRAIEEEIDAGVRSPFFDVPFADHTDRRPDPPEIGGRVPDAIRMNELTGEMTVVEKETHPDTGHSREQVDDLRQGAQRLGLDFDLDIVDDDDLLW